MISRRQTARITVVALLLALVPVCNALGAGLTVTTDSAGLEVGQPFRLVLTRDGNYGPGATPDLGPLDAAFEVLGTGSSSETRIVNGQRSDTMSWTVTLAPKSAGTVTVPELHAGSQSSEPVELQVAEAGQSPPSEALASTGVRMQVVVEPGTRHEYEEIPVTLLIADPIGLSAMELTEPQSDAFTLRHVGEDRSRQVAGSEGRRIKVLERHYVLTPRKSGTLTLPPITLQARLPDTRGGGSPFAGRGMSDMFARAGFAGVFDRGRPVTLRSEPVAIEVAEAPSGSSAGWFLPARDVQLEDDWSAGAPEGEQQLALGETASRTVRMTALGASAEQLPELEIGNVDGARIYVDRTRDSSVDTADGTAAVREYDLSIVPTRAGQVMLPAIEVAWWDTDADEQKTARLASYTFAVSGDAAATTRLDATPGEASASDSTESATGLMPQPPRMSGADSSIVRVAAAGLALLLIALGVRRSSWWQSWRVGHQDNRRHRSRRRQLQRELLQCCGRNDGAGAYRAACAWLQHRYPGASASPRSIADAAPRTSDALSVLESALYDPSDAAAWHGQVLASAFVRERRQLLGRPPRSGGRRIARTVPALYPIG